MQVSDEAIESRVEINIKVNDMHGNNSIEYVDNGNNLKVSRQRSELVRQNSSFFDSRTESRRKFERQNSSFFDGSDESGRKLVQQNSSFFDGSTESRRKLVRQNSSFFDIESRNDENDDFKDIEIEFNQELSDSCATCDSKYDDDSLQSDQSSQKDETQDEESNSSNAKKHPKQFHPTFKRKKSCLSVRTQEESLSTSSLSRSSKSDKDVKRVSFNKVQIREYQIQLVNHPACTGGPPIGIGWNYSEKEDIDLKDANDNQCINLDNKQPLKDVVNNDDKCKNVVGEQLAPYEKILCIKPFERLAMLKNNGYTDMEIVECMLEVKASQKQRKKSAAASDEEEEMIEMVNKVVNKVTKKLKKFCRSKEQRKQDKLCKVFGNVNDDTTNEDVEFQLNL